MNRRQHVLSFVARCRSPFDKTKIIHEAHTDIQVSRCAVRSALLSQRIAVQLVHDSLQHGGMHRKHIDGEAHMCRCLSSPMQ